VVLSRKPYNGGQDEDDGRSKIHQGVIDLNFLVMAESKQYWFFADPQIILD